MWKQGKKEYLTGNGFVVLSYTFELYSDGFLRMNNVCKP